MPNELESFPDLPNLLEREIGNFESFRAMNSKRWPGLLKQVLGDANPLVPTIIDHMNEVCSSENLPPSLIDKVAIKLLAPSSVLVAKDVLSVLRYCFKSPFQTLEGFHRFVKSKPVLCGDDTAPVTAEYVAQYSQVLDDFVFVTPDLTVKEANGYPMLGVFSLCILNCLKVKYPEKKFFVEPSYTVWNTNRPGPDYATDHALGEFVTLAIGEMPNNPVKRVDLCYEYKPRVPSDLSNVEPSHLSEITLQAFYLKQQKVQQDRVLLHCLTDLTDFYYMTLILDSSNKTLKIRNYQYFKVDITQSDELAKHMGIVLNVLKENYDIQSSS